MGKKGRKGHKMPAWRRYGRMIVGGVGAALGVLIATSPTHRAISQYYVKGDLVNGNNALVQDTIGLSTPTSGNVDPAKVIGVGVVAGLGLGIMLLFRKLARRL